MKYLLVPMIFLAACATPCRGVIGAGYDTNTRIIDSIYEGTPAEEIGMKVGDTLVKVEGEETPGSLVSVYFISNNKLIVAEVYLMCIDELREWK